MQPAPATWTPSSGDGLVDASAVISYDLFTDEQLISERDRLRNQLDELTINPGSSPVISQILVNMAQKIERMTDDLRQRAISRHRPPGMSRFRRLRSTSWPPQAG